MKKRFYPLIFIPLFALTSCLNFLLRDTYEKVINVYDIDAIDDTNLLSSGYQNTITARFVEGEEHIPYLTLKQYASLYNKHLEEGVENEVSDVYQRSNWTVRKGETFYFSAIISYDYSEVVLAGSLEAAYAPNDDSRDMKALNYGIEIDSEGSKFLSDKTYATFSYSGYGITTFKNNGDIYYPLSFLDITFSDATSIYFTYNYKHILSTRETDKYAEKEYIDDGNVYTFDTQMIANTPMYSMPDYLIRYNANLFLYLMDNFYGLKKEKGIKSFSSYYRSKGLYNNLFAINGGTRGQGYSDALSVLDDGHTVLLSVNQSWGEYFLEYRRYGEKARERNNVASTLKRYRKNTYDNYMENGSLKSVTAGKDILYSQDGKTALFSFDSFEFGTTDQVFNNDNSIKDTAKEYDTFFRFIDVLNTIKNKGTVNNVIFDVSLNGGGVVGVMLKLLALLSKNNNGYVAFYDDTTTQLGLYNAKVDSNNDGLYNSLDCYGNNFNFYILTSAYSYSCANAFPCSAQIKNVAKIIGQKSGGGECAVAIHYLPNSEYVYHSSNLHLGYYNEALNKFEGFEKGATPDIEIAINENFYSVESLNTAISNAQ